MEFELVLGLEIHLQLTTKTKMFCYCKNDPFASEPNVHVCPVCLGLPGALPVPNRDAIIAAQRIAHAFGSKLNSYILFERKNYFYPDLPKGYQITTPHHPISTGGEMDLSYWSHDKIRFSEIHIEEDTGKSRHEGDKTLLDYNKSGVPLLEIVTMPDFRDVEVAVEYCKEIQRVARALKVSEADMEKGHMRLEANISLRKIGSINLPDYKVEIKNINSFSFMRKAINYEIKRQTEALLKGEKLIQETRGFNEAKSVTFSQREKENAHDYRYFPEPDIPVAKFDTDWLSEVAGESIELPSHKRRKYLEIGLKKNYIGIFIDNIAVEKKFNEIVDLLKQKTSINNEFTDLDYNKAANWVINVASYRELSAEQIIEEETSRNGKKLDESELFAIVERVLKNNPSSITQYKLGKLNVLQFLMGQVMRETKGKADPVTIRSKLEERLSLNK